MSVQAGADLAAGSLIKSPGGTIVPGGGYVAGRAELVAAAAARLTAPGVGIDAGCVSGTTLRLMFQGAITVITCSDGRQFKAYVIPFLSFLAQYPEAQQASHFASAASAGCAHSHLM